MIALDPEEGPLEVPSGVSTTPPLPVSYALDGAGFAAFKEAVGGRLKLDAWAEVELAVGEWESGRFVFKGAGVGVGVGF